MLFFEWKKLRRQRLLFLLLLFAVLWSGYVFLETKRERPNEYYHQTGIMSHPQNSSMNDMYHYIQRKQISDDPLNPELEKEWNALRETMHDLMGRRYDWSQGDPVPTEENFQQYEEEALAFIRAYDAFLKKHHLIFSKESHEGLRWALFEAERADMFGSYSTSSEIAGYTNTSLRLLLFNSRRLFGFPFFAFFLFLFAGIFSKEREQGSMEFIETQPTERWKVLGAKLGALWFSTLLYFVAVFVIWHLLCRWKGVPFGGTREIFRVFGRGNAFSYVLGGDLLRTILMAYLSMVLFFSALLLFVNTRTESTLGTLSIFVAVFALGYAVTEHVERLQSHWNPIYLSDFFQGLTGRMIFRSSSFGEVAYQIHHAAGIQPYAVYALLSVPLMLRSLKPKPRTEEDSSEKGGKEKIASVSLLAFEWKKIVGIRPFKFLVSSALFFVFLLFVFLFFRNEEMRDRYVHPFKELRRYQYNVKSYEDSLREQRKRGLPEESLVMMVEGVEESKKELEDYKGRLKAYHDGDGAHFYPSLVRELRRMLGDEDKDGRVRAGGTLKHDFFSDATFYESMAVLKKAESMSVKPLFLEWGMSPSAYEEYVDAAKRRQIVNRHMPVSNSAVFTLYSMFDRKRLDILFLCFVCFLVFAGYTLDKERGRQIELLYTEPVSRCSYHLIKLGVSVLVAAGMLLLVMIALFLFGLLSEGVGAWNFPVVCYENLLTNPRSVSVQEMAQSISLLPMWKYLFRLISVILVQCFFLSALFHIWSIFVRDRVKLMILSAFTLGIGFFLSDKLLKGEWRAISPFFYLEATRVANGSATVFHQLPGETFGLALVSLLWGGFLFTIAGLYFSERHRAD